MTIFLKITAGILSTIAFVLLILFCVPASRDFIINSIVPYSEKYQEQEKDKEDLQNAYIKNLNELNQTRIDLAKAEQTSSIYESELRITQNIVLDTRNQLNLANTELMNVQVALSESNADKTILQNEISIKQSQYDALSAEIDHLIENSGDQTEIDSLNEQLNNTNQELQMLDEQLWTLQEELLQKNEELSSCRDQVAMLEMTINDYQNTENSLREEINFQREIIDGLNAEIDSILYENLVLSFSSLTDFRVFHKDSPFLEYSDNQTSSIELVDLLDFNENEAEVKFFSGSCRGGHVSSPDKHEIEIQGDLEIRPLTSNISFFLWNSATTSYVDINNSNVQSFIDAGYTSVEYTIYSVQYAGGVVSCHINFRNMS